MTFQRVLNRNKLADGNYENVPTEWAHHGPTYISKEKVDALYPASRVYDQWKSDNDYLNRKLALLAGDLRRLEKDMVDEKPLPNILHLRPE